ncbi:hypothetical protein Sdiek1_1828 [Sulfurospirillum diekertiae]|uniref:Uncharacterized protein n=1 Tax=Sulfurospirillum diekertiae TaxID=1854492 RepID=A0A1Y0HLJ6_9BACT|nr:hypothetical protein Sdiek1_1828 [Sulfurospirillum diekertiae]
MSKSLYETLDVSQDASAEEIKKSLSTFSSQISP